MNKQKLSLLLTVTLVFASLPPEMLYAKEAASGIAAKAPAKAVLENPQTQDKSKEWEEANEITIIRKDEEEAEEDLKDENALEAAEERIEREIIEITSAEEFLDFAANCHVDAWSYDKQVELRDNIDVSGYKIEPIPVFDGVFEGNGHTISGFRYTGSGYVTGLFRYVGKHGRIENLTLEGAVSSSDEKQCVGGICGNNEGIIRGCKFSGTVNGRTETGGIAGVNRGSGRIENCVTQGRISGYYYTGGTVGKNHGNISSCINHGSINDDSAWVEEDDQSGGFGWLENVGTGNTVRLQSGVDTGGIAGYSDGVIVSCSNAATVGYEHTGYNIGGIVGRQAGLLSSCTNKGTVYGRKDVGGIVGQMEPYIKLNAVQSVEEEIQKLHDLIDKTLEDMDDAGNVLTEDFDTLIGYSDGALNKSHGVVSQMSSFVDDNVGAVSQAADRLEYVINRLPEVLDPFSASMAGIKGIGNDIKKLNDDLNIIKDMEITDYDETDYKRLSLVTGIGGSLTADNNDPAEGAVVTLYAKPEAGYGIGPVTARDADGNAIAVTNDGSGNFRFEMPARNVCVSAEFVYKGTYLAASQAGGLVTVSEGTDTVNISVRLSAGYRMESLSIGGVTAPMSGAGSVTVNKSDYPAGGSPVLVYGAFTKDMLSDGEDGANYITCEAGTGGGLICDLKTAEAGEEVRLVATQKPGYRMKSLKLRSESGDIAYSRQGDFVYLFTMPAGDVTAEAEFEPIRFGMTSNAGGSASYSNTVSGNTIHFTLNPASGYTLAQEPAVNGQGGMIPVSKVKADSYEYEVKIAGEQEPALAVVQFTRQKQNTSIQGALNSMRGNADNLTGAMDRISAVAKEIGGIIMNADGSTKDWGSLSEADKNTLLTDIMELSQQLSSAKQSASSMLSSISLIGNVTAPYLDQMAENTYTDIERLTEHIQEVVDDLLESTEGIKSIVNYLNGQQNIHFTQMGDDFDNSVDDLYAQLEGISDTMKSINAGVYEHAGVLNEDFRGINDQLNVVLLLFIDRMDRLEHPRTSTIYEDISDEDIEETVQGKVTRCTNKGMVQGDINIGGIAGAMSIDKEDPEENAAGSVEISLGNTYLTKCILNDSKNYGYVTAKKDGAGCIAGYMNLGVIANCEAYGGAESTEGDYVGGICGQSLAVIQKCYSLCSLSGGKYVGGIAGYGDAINNCYSMTEAEAAGGRAGAIAGQVASREDDDILRNIKDNYYVGDELYGIDDISYVGAAEPVTYSQLLTTENLPVDYRHLKVTFLADNKFLGTQELKYGESLSNLKFPRLADKENTNGVWPKVADRTMKGNLVLAAEYEDNITVLDSEEQRMTSQGEKILRKSLALAEGKFTGMAILHARVNENHIPPYSVTKGKDYTIYDISLENVQEQETGEKISLRLLNEGGEKTVVWEYADEEWKQAETKVRGQYLQVTMEGNQGTFCMVNGKSAKSVIWIGIGGVLAAAVLSGIIIRKKQK